VTALSGSRVNSDINGPRKHEGHEEESLSSSWFRVFVAINAAGYPDAAESGFARV